MTIALSFLVVGGGILVFISRSPYFSALGVVGAVVGFSGFLVLSGSVFIGLILFLMYLGGMLVVFAYSAALASDRYPDVGWSKAIPLVIIFGGLVPYFVVEGGGGGWEVNLVEEVSLVGVSSLYGPFLVGLLVGGFGLFACLLVVLYLVRGLTSGALRAV
uniref:NADH-ubiquinone oxidoreductase chain 6 n=1 Tax=Balanoglossus clavigerus TaxID=560604 RepID=D3H5X3_BALCL|nr:NADH dehydrogenase subunit 6 [Balanoglossus clavigerus]CBH40147.1 NADH dehydrogenase subunit 6 [Balanoglossus clavigerus]